jgi:hypothetical protein
MFYPAIGKAPFDRIVLPNTPVPNAHKSLKGFILMTLEDPVFWKTSFPETLKNNQNIS